MYYTEFETNREKSIAIVEEMVKCGYHLFNETPAEFVDRTGFMTSVYAEWFKNFKKTKGLD